MVAVTVLVAVLITETLLLPPSVTYAVRPSGLTATPYGESPTGMVAVTAPVAASYALTVLLPEFATYAYGVPAAAGAAARAGDAAATSAPAPAAATATATVTSSAPSRRRGRPAAGPTVPMPGTSDPLSRTGSPHVQLPSVADITRSDYSAKVGAARPVAGRPGM